MSVFVGAPGSTPSKEAGVTGAFELNTIVYVRLPPESTGSALIIGCRLVISILIFLGSIGVGVGNAVGEGLTDGLGLGLGEGDGDPAGFSTLRVLVS
jgi:hypothetical protein